MTSRSTALLDAELAPSSHALTVENSDTSTRPAESAADEDDSLGAPLAGSTASPRKGYSTSPPV